MHLLLWLFGAAVGFWFCAQWENHRNKHYKKLLTKIQLFADTMKQANLVLTHKLERLEHLNKPTREAIAEVVILNSIIEQYNEKSAQLDK